MGRHQVGEQAMPGASAGARRATGDASGIAVAGQPVVVVAAWCLIVALAQCGCVGAWVWHNDRAHFEAPQIYPEEPGKVLNPVKTSVPSRQEMSRSDLERHWGAADEVEVIDARTARWRYVSDGLRWNGIMPIIGVVPIPLLVPMGRESVTFTIRDERVVAADFLLEDDGHVLFGLVLVPGPCPYFDWATASCSNYDDDDDEREIRPSWLKRRRRAPVSPPPLAPRAAPGRRP